MITPSALLLRFAATAVAALLCVFALNALVDPYGYLGTPTLAGFNERKPTALMHDRYFKAGLARGKRADCLLAGSSRIGEGIPPVHKVFADCRGVLDLSLAGPNVDEMTRIVEAAERQQGHARLVILSLDFFAFNATREPTRGGNATTFADDRLGRIRTSSAMLGSVDTMLDSIRTLAGQHAPSFYLSDGSVDQSYLAHLAEGRSTRTAFLKSVRGYILHHLPAPRHQFALSQGSRQPLRELRHFLESQHAAGTQVHLFFSPAHAWQWELIDAMGLWPLWEQWKHEVVAANEAAAAQAGRPPFALWDFAGYVGPALEPVPDDLLAVQPLEHYWDSSHFKQSLGAMILRRMLRSGDADGFGELRTSANLDEALAFNRQRRDAWRASHAADHDDVQAVVRCFAPVEVLSRLHLPRVPGARCQSLTAATR